jgi:hypothetical protein
LAQQVSIACKSVCVHPTADRFVFLKYRPQKLVHATSTRNTSRIWTQHASNALLVRGIRKQIVCGEIGKKINVFFDEENKTKKERH